MIKVSRETIEKISRFLDSTQYESGGLIGSSNGEMIDVFYYDKGKRSNTYEYIPDVNKLQRQLLNWDEAHIIFQGIIHSHSISDRLSPRDIQMAREILNMNKLSKLYMPIYLLNARKFFWYEVSNVSVSSIDQIKIT